jgi:hypothetical protein
MFDACVLRVLRLLRVLRTVSVYRCAVLRTVSFTLHYSNTAERQTSLNHWKWLKL